MKILIVLFLTTFSHIVTNDAFEIRSRIVGGYSASTGQFPYFAHLEIQHQEKNKYVGCGSTLIAEDWLLTAAHCLFDRPSLIVHLGQTDYNSDEREYILFSVEEKNFIIHPDYNSIGIKNDIALIRLPRKVKLSEFIQPVKLPTACESTVNVEVLAIGKGVTSNDGKTSDELKFAFLKTISPAACHDTFPVFSRRKTVICAKNDVHPMNSVCRGDSGGPIVRRADDTLIGISSFVHADGCEDGLPQGFSNVYPYLDWIRQHTDLNVPSC